MPPFVVAVTTALAAGAMLTMIVDTMIPEAVAETHDWAGFAAVAGFLVSATLTSLEV
jgi:ZIP family zinc transporter